VRRLHAVPLRPVEPSVQILALCTANQCRSPMAEVLLRRALEARGIDAVVRSAGLRPGGFPASPGSVRAMARRRLVLDGHCSHQLLVDDVTRADLVVCMARSHAREAVVLHPVSWPRTFTLKELVRRGGAIGPRRPDQPFDEWLTDLGRGRQRGALMGADPDDDVADPIGGPDTAYEATAALLEDLITRAVALAFPGDLLRR